MKKSLLAFFAFIIVAASAEQARACHALPLLNPQAVPVPGGLQVTGDSDGATCGCGEYWLDVEVVCINQPFTGSGFPSTPGYPGLTGPVFYNSAQWLKPNCVQMAHPWVTISFSQLCPGTTYKYRMREHHATGVPPAGPWTSTFTFTTPGAPPSFTLNAAAVNPAICLPQTTTLNTTVTGGCAGVSYSWSPAASLSCSTCANPVASPTVTTTYTVTVTEQCSGAILTSQVQVYVGNPPAAGVASASPSGVCSGSSATLTLSGSSGNIQWQESTDNIVFTNIAGATSATYTTTGLTDTMYYQALVTDPGCGSTNSNSVAINVFPNPVVAASSNAAAICLGNNTTLSATGATNYSWSPSSGLSNPNTASPVASPTVTTTYTVTGTDANGCTNMASVQVTVNQASVTASNNVAVCNGSSVSISATGPNAISYSWAPNNGTLNNTSVANPVATPTITTTYTVTLTDINGCLAVDSVQVAIQQLPSASAGIDAAICEGSGVLLSASGGVSYTWAPSTGLNTTSNSSPFATPSSTTTYTVTVTGSNGCVGIDSVVVTVNPPPSANAGPNTTFCNGNPGVQLNATGGVTYSWTPSAGLNNPNIANPVATPSGTTNYTVTVTDANGCVAQDVVQVSVAAPPTVNASNNVTLCSGGSTSLTASGALTYSWTPSTGLNNPNIPNPSVTGLSATTTYTVTGTDANGCTDTDVVTVAISSTPQMSNITTTQAVCGDDNGTIDVGSTTGGTPPLTYSIGSQQSSTGDFTNLPAGFYTITVTDANGCTSQQSVTVTPILGVNAALSASVLEGVMPLPVTFTNASTGANNFTWDFGDGTVIPTTTTGAMSHTYTAPGTYTVTLTAWNNTPSCSDVTSLIIVVTEEVAIEIPNVFTPNGDNNNDVFKINAKGVKEISAVIYNRWGRKVAEWTGDAASGWDGKAGGGEAEDGVYYYVINATGTNGQTTPYRGFVELIRKK